MKTKKKNRFNKGTKLTYKDGSKWLIKQECLRLISEDISKSLLDQFNSAICKPNEKLFQDFINEYNFVPWFIFNVKISQQFIQKNISIFDKKCWDAISLYQEMSMSFINNNISKLNIEYLMYNHNLSKKDKMKIYSTFFKQKNKKFNNTPKTIKFKNKFFRVNDRIVSINYFCNRIAQWNYFSNNFNFSELYF
jgi:hypothetical protein